MITWQRSVYESYRDDRSVVSSRTTSSRPSEPEVVSKAPSVTSHAPSVASRGGSIARSFSAPVSVPQTTTTSDAGDGTAKKIIGTLLGAAAGAAVAYAMVRSEQDSAKKEADFSVLMEAKNTVKAAMGLYAQATTHPKQTLVDSQPIDESAQLASVPVYREIDVESYHSSTPSGSHSAHVPRQIEAASPSYYSPSHVSALKAAPKTLEYAPAHSVAPSHARSRHTVTRSVTSPEILMIEKIRSVAPSAKPQSVLSVPKTRSVAHSIAPSSLISSFVPDQVPRRVSEGSVHSSRSKARSSHSHVSRHTSHSKHSYNHHTEAIKSSPSPPPYTSKAPSKAASIVSSILGRDAKCSISKQEDFVDHLEIQELTEDDLDTVVPSDSISNAGSSSRRSHRRKKHSDSSVVSKHSSTSKHSHRSHRSHKPHSHHSSDEASESKPKSKSRRSTVISEPSDATTVKPRKRESSRKDSLMNGQYEGLYDEVNGKGSVAAVPIRGITPSMVSVARKNETRTMVHWGMAQKARAFEGGS